MKGPRGSSSGVAPLRPRISGRDVVAFVHRSAFRYLGYLRSGPITDVVDEGDGGVAIEWLGVEQILMAQ